MQKPASLPQTCLLHLPPVIATASCCRTRDTMAFITHCCKKIKASLRTPLFRLPHGAWAAALAAALCAWLCLLSAPARAEGVDFRDARLAPREEGWALEADFDIELPARLEEAVN